MVNLLKLMSLVVLLTTSRSVWAEDNRVFLPTLPLLTIICQSEEQIEAIMLANLRLPQEKSQTVLAGYKKTFVDCNFGPVPKQSSPLVIKTVNMLTFEGRKVKVSIIKFTSGPKFAYSARIQHIN